MRYKNNDNILVTGALFGLFVVGFTVNYIKAIKVDKKVDSLGNHVNTNFNEFAKTYNNSIDFEDERYNDISSELFDVKDEIGVCYEHIEALSKKLDKSEEVEIEV